MKRMGLLILAPGLVMASLALMLMLLMAMGNVTKEWTCHCDGEDHWQCTNADCDAKASAHLDATRHGVACTRSDWPTRLVVRVVGWIIPEPGESD